MRTKVTTAFLVCGLGWACGWLAPWSAGGQEPGAPGFGLDDASTAAAKRDFLATVRRYTEGEVTAAVRELAELEPSVSRGDLQTVELAPNVFVEVLAELAKREPEILVPAADLYARLSVRYLRRQMEVSATKTRRKVLRLLGVYRRLSQAPDADAIAARLLADLGCAAWVAPEYAADLSSLHDALSLDARNPAALHVLAWWAEKQENYTAARQLLTRLIAVEPDNGAAHLRLAMVRATRGHDRRAVEHLETVIRGPGPRWAIIVACQERARAYQAAGESERAMATLREARHRFPENQRLAQQLAFLLKDRPAEAREVLRAVSARTSWEGPTPRAIYNNLPLDELGRIQQLRRQELAERLPLLAAAVAERPALTRR